METFFGIVIILFIVLILARRLLLPSAQRWMMGKMEDRFRRMAGMPTRKEERRQRRAERRQNSSSGRRARATDASRNRDAGPTPRRGQEPIIPKDYAEDVEFVEIKSYSAEEIIVKSDSSDKTKYTVESQIEDVEYVEIKGAPTNKE